MKQEKVSITAIDVKLALGVGTCILLSYLANVTVGAGYFQIMTAAIAVVLCTQESPETSWKSGMIRMLITLIGGVTGICVILLDNIFQSKCIFVLLVVAGILATLLLGKIAKVPQISCRIGCVCYILVILTKTGLDRVEYAIFRLIATLIGVIVVWIWAEIWHIFENKKIKGGE